jgi:hypothetical protein
MEQADTIRMDAELGPPSRPTLSDSPRALGSDAGLDHGERAFFREGDEGRYAGGPATLVPITFDDEPAAAQVAPPDPRRLARRRGFSRAVAMLVGALAAVALVAGLRPTPSAHAGATIAGETHETAPRPQAATVAVVASPKPKPSAPSELTPRVVAQTKAERRRASGPALRAIPLPAAPTAAPTPPTPAAPSSPPPTAAFPPAP